MTIFDVHIPSIAENIFAGVIVTLLFPIYNFISARFGRILLRRIFGNDFRPNGSYHIVYAPLALRRDFCHAAINANLEQPNFPFEKHRQLPNRPSFRFNVETAVAGCELRAANYLATFFACHANVRVSLSPDIGIKENYNISFVTLGGPGGNLKTSQTQEDPENNLIKMLRASTFISASNIDNGLHCIIRQADNSEYDYGIILRIRPGNYKNRVWIACMGFDERGTSGAAWFLSNKWKKLISATLSLNPKTWINGSNFAALIKVRKDSDQSAMLVSKKHLVNSPEDVFAICDGLCSLWYDHTINAILGERTPAVSSPAQADLLPELFPSHSVSLSGSACPPESPNDLIKLIYDNG